MLFSNADDYKMCAEVVRSELFKRNVTVSDDILEKITEDVMNITYAKGGDYSYDTVQAFAEVYVEEEFYKKHLGNVSCR